uniref:GAG-pre-integrase domain-containing protein n=1 Tax=Tanacetum cinerariifolium TaxID=118510 RepID=A0A6L2N5N3_TANCI|nr:hypothetical protein [Tanacetum cinerariifolium]
MTLLNTLMETCATLSQKVAQLKQDKITQALEILKLKKRVKKLEKKRRSKSYGLKRLRKVGGKIEAIDVDKDITLVDTETQVDAELQDRIDGDNASTKKVNTVEPTVFDDEEENINWNAVAEQIQEKHLDNIRKYQSLKRKLISIAQARKNMIIYLKNMAGYKMEHFRGMTYDKVRPIFEREYNKVQTLFKPNKDVEEPQKKRVAEETLLQKSFKKLKAVEVSGSESTQDTITNDPKEMSEEDVQNMLEIVPVFEFKVEALQVKYPLIDWEIHSEGSRSYWKIIRVSGITEAYQSFEDMSKGFDKEDLDALWRLVKEKFSSAVPTVDKEKALWVKLKRLFEPDTDNVLRKLQRYIHYPIIWKLYYNCGVHQVSSTTRRHDMFMLTEKNYPLSNGVMTLMLSAKLQVEEDSDMARYLVMKIFMEANKPKSKRKDYVNECVNNKKSLTGHDPENGDHPLPVITQVSLPGTISNVPPPLKDKSMWTAEGKKNRKIDRLARSLLIQGLLNDIYSLIDNNNSAKEWKQYGAMMRQNKNLMNINIDALYNILKQNQGDVNEAMGHKKKAVVVTSDPLALVAEKTKVTKRREKVVVQSESEGSDDEDISDLIKITALLAKAFNRKKYYAKPTNNNLRTSSASSSANKKPKYVKSEEKKEDKKDDSDQEINANMACMAKMEKVLSDSEESSSSSEETIAKFNENRIVSQIDHDESEVDHNDSEEKGHLVDKLITKFNQKIAKCQKRIEKANQQSKYLENQNKDLQDIYDVLKNQVNTFEEKNNEFNQQIKVSNETNVDLLAQIEVLQEQLKVKHVVIDTHTELKELRPSLYDERIIGLGYTLMFLTHSNEALEIEKFKRARENKIEFAYDYGNLNATNKFTQTICFDCDFRKIIIDFEDEVVSLLEKEKEKLEIIESLKSKGFESHENAIIESKNQSENNCHKNSKVIAPGMFKVNVSQSVSPILAYKTSCASNNVENKTKRKRRKRTSSKQNHKQVNNDVLRANRDFVHFLGLDTLSSVRRPKHSGVIWNKKGTSNTSTVDLSSVSILKLSKDVKRNSRKDLLSCNNSHHVDTRSAYTCNDAMNVSCNSRLYASCDVNDLFVFDDVSIRKSQVSKMSFRKKPRDSLNHMTGNRALLTNFVEKFLGTIHFGNNDFTVIAGYGDVVIGSMTINKVYYVEAKASSSQSWLWHQRLSYLNLTTINNLVKNNLVRGLPKMKFEKDHLCSACEQGKTHQKYHNSKTDFASNMPLHLFHMDLCSPMRDTIQYGKVIVEQVQVRQGQSYAGTGYKGNATSSGGNNAERQTGVVKCYNYQAQESGQILDKGKLVFLADPGIQDDQAAQTTILNNVAFQTEDLDAYDSDCDDVSNAKAVLMVNLSNYGLDVILEVPHFEPYHTNMDNQSVHAMQSFEQTPVVDFTDNEITTDSNIIPYSQYLQETQQITVQDNNLYAQQDSMILFVIEQMFEQIINHVNNLKKANQEKNNESLTAELEKYKERVKTFEQRLNIDLSTREKIIDSQIDDMIKKKRALKPQIYSLEQNLYNQIK